MTLGSLGAVGVAVPALLAAIPPILAAAWWLRNYATRSMSELKRLDGVSRSPLHSRLSQAAAALVVIRAFRQEPPLRRTFEERLNVNATAWWWWLVCNRRFGLTLDLVSSLVLVLLVIVAVWTKAAAAGNPHPQSSILKPQPQSSASASASASASPSILNPQASAPPSSPPPPSPPPSPSPSPSP